MSEQEKKEQIRGIVNKMFNKTVEQLNYKIDKALNSGAIDIDAWDEDSNPYLVPKAILIAFLRDEAEQYTCKGTSFEKQVKNDAKNIGYNL